MDLPNCVRARAWPGPDFLMTVALSSVTDAAGTPILLAPTGLRGRMTVGLSLSELSIITYVQVLSIIMNMTGAGVS